MNIKSPLLLAILFTLIITIGFELKNYILFHPDKKTFYPKPEKVQEFFVQGRKNNKIWCWYYSAGEGSPIVLFSHGNAGNITFRTHIVTQLISRGISFIMFDYRGYGKSTGKTQMSTMFHDIEDVYKYMISTLNYKKDQVVVVGESIGSYPASKLATKYQCRKLIILYGLHSLSLTVKHLYPLLYPFAKLFVSKDLKVYEELKKYNGDTLILHSKEDKIVNYNNALENSKIKTNGNIKLITITGGHNDAVIDWESINQFIKT